MALSLITGRGLASVLYQDHPNSYLTRFAIKHLLGKVLMAARNNKCDQSVGGEFD